MTDSENDIRDAWSDLPLDEKLWLVMMLSILAALLLLLLGILWLSGYVMAALTDAGWMTPWTGRVIFTSIIVLVIGAVHLHIRVTARPKYRDGQ